jgi:hypothetical protein
MKEEKRHTVQEPLADYEKAETDLLREALKRSYAERYHMMMKLMKMNIMFRNSSIEHKPLREK